MLPWVCSVIDHRRRQNVVRTSVTHSAIASCATFLFLPHFDVICDLLLNRRTATWNLFVKLILLAKEINLNSKSETPSNIMPNQWTRFKLISRLVWGSGCVPPEVFSDSLLWLPSFCVAFSRVLETKISSGTQDSYKVSSLFTYLRLGFDFFSPIC